MPHPMLEITVSRAGGVVEPGGDKNSRGRGLVGKYIKKTENLRFGVAESMEDHSWFQVRVRGKVHGDFHSQSPIALMVSLGKPKAPVQLPTHGPHRAVAHYGQGRPDIHSGHITPARVAFAVHLESCLVTT